MAKRLRDAQASIRACPETDPRYAHLERQELVLRASELTPLAETWNVHRPRPYVIEAVAVRDRGCHEL